MHKFWISYGYLPWSCIFKTFTFSLKLWLKQTYADFCSLRLTVEENDVWNRVRANIRIFKYSKYWYSYSICGNFQSRILFKYSNIFVQIFPNIFPFLTWRYILTTLLITKIISSFKHRASLQSRTLYVISENFSSLHYKLFENIRIFWTIRILFEYILQHE